MLFQGVNHTLAMTAKSTKQVESEIKNIFLVFENQLSEKMLSFRILLNTNSNKLLLIEWELYELVVFQLV